MATKKAGKKGSEGKGQENLASSFAYGGNMNSNKKKESFIGSIILIVILSNFLCMFCFLILNWIFQGRLETLASVFSLIFSFMLVPFLILQKVYDVTLNEIRVIKAKALDYILLFVMIAYSFILWYLKGNVNSFISISIQQISVSIAEEFLMRGIILYLLCQLFQKKYWIVIINAIIFGFFLHTGGDFLSNFLYRFPAGIILAVLTLYTGRLYPAIMLHFMYNIWCIYL